MDWWPRAKTLIVPGSAMGGALRSDAGVVLINFSEGCFI